MAITPVPGSLRGAKRRGNPIKKEANIYFYEIATLPSVARNGHKGHRMLLFLYISFKICKYNQVLLKKILCLCKQDRESFLLSLLDPFNKHAKNQSYVAY